MKTKQQIMKLLAMNKPELEKRFGVKTLALFGSYARGDMRPDSDVDILVDVPPEIGLEFVTLADRLENLLGLPVELVSRRAINTQFYQSLEGEIEYV
ncbi:MAG: nucleotidyltransferase family protein [Thermodesulfobacteriota bacterium]